VKQPESEIASVRSPCDPRLLDASGGSPSSVGSNVSGIADPFNGHIDEFRMFQYRQRGVSLLAAAPRFPFDPLEGRRWI
jgi:hypothetical protein